MFFFFTLLHSCQRCEHPLILIIPFIIKFSVLGRANTLEKSPEEFTDVHDYGVRGLVFLVANLGGTKDLTGVDDDSNGEFTIDDGPGDVNDSLANVILSRAQSAAIQDGFHSCSSLHGAYEMFFVNMILCLDEKQYSHPHCCIQIYDLV